MTIAVPLIVSPGEVLFLLVLRELAEVSVGIAMSLAAPALVVDDFLIVPHVVVGVVRVVHTIVVMRAAHPGQRRNQRRSEKRRPKTLRSAAHNSSPCQGGKPPCF